MPIYLDANATTPLFPEVREAMEAALRDLWGNPSSAHPAGAAARRAIDRAREEVAALLGARPDEILFTSGGTESDNAAVLGAARAAEGPPRLVLTAIEHPAVEEPARLLERREGAAVVRLRPGPGGRIDPGEAIAALDGATTLVSVMHSNNETGVLQPVAEIARAARERGIPVHTDAAQSVGKVPLSVDDLGADLLTVAGHKLGGPKGVGALYVRAGARWAPFLLGAGHERGRRAGTENTAGIVGLGRACALARAEAGERAARLAAARDRLQAALLRAVPGAVVHGADAPRLPNTLSIAFPGADAHDLLERLGGEVAASPGAACHARERIPSRVLTAMGVPPGLAAATVRFSVWTGTTPEEIDGAAETIARAARERAAAR